MRSYRLSDDVTLNDLKQLSYNYYSYLSNYTYIDFWEIIAKFLAQNYARLQVMSACAEAENHAARKVLKSQIEDSQDFIERLLKLNNTLSASLPDNLPNSLADKTFYQDSMREVYKEIINVITHQLPTHAELKILNRIATTMIDLYQDPTNVEKYNVFDKAVKSVPANPFWKNLAIALVIGALATVIMAVFMVPPVMVICSMLPIVALLHVATSRIANFFKNPETKPEGDYFHKGYTFDHPDYDATLSGRLNLCRSNSLSLIRKHALFRPVPVHVPTLTPSLSEMEDFNYYLHSAPGYY